jgi:hypothetical protein
MTELVIDQDEIAYVSDLHDQYLPLPDGVSLDGCWLMLDGMVNLDDLVSPNRPGKVVRMRSPDALKYIPPSMDDYERIAGMISDAV